MINRKSGFTLMEIMVVIIVIAVLASVAGPMIGSITDQGRASATKSKMSSLKSAMLAYQSDTGRLPFSGKPKCAACIAVYCTASVLGPTTTNNVLVNDTLGTLAGFNFEIANYGRKWKGPYMDSEPADFMFDAWGQPLVYVAHKNNVYLWSSGANQGFEGAGTGCIECALCGTMVGNGDVDDIFITISRSRAEFK